MTDVAPEGPLSVALVLVEQTLAALPAWAEWVADTDGATAAGQVFLGEAPVGHLSPGVLVDWDNGLTFTATDLGDEADDQQDGQVLLGFRWRVPAGMSDRNARVTFNNKVGTVLRALGKALKAPLRQEGCTRLDITLQSGPDRTTVEERAAGDDWMESVWTLSLRSWP